MAGAPPAPPAHEAPPLHGVPPLMRLALLAAARGDAWLSQRRSLERLPPDLADALLARLLARADGPFALAPHRLERFARCVTRVAMTGEQLAAPAAMLAWISSFE
jgi:hypothetical protein